MFIAITLFINLSCGGNDRDAMLAKINIQFKTCLQKVTSSQNIAANIYMVIPRAGCSSCITSAESFMMSCIKDSSENKKNVRFVLTDFDSEKILRARFGDLYSNPMLIIDKNNIFRSNNSLKSIYPTIFFFKKNGELINVSECSPNRDGLSEINIFLASKVK